MKNLFSKIELFIDEKEKKLEKINISYPADLLTGVLFFSFSLILLLILPTQVKISEKDLVNGRAFPSMLIYVMMAMSLMLCGKEILKILQKKSLEMKTVNMLVEVKALVIAAILIITYFIAKSTDLFVLGALFCSIAFMLFFRCKKKSYYAITITAAVLIWTVFRFVLGVDF